MNLDNLIKEYKALSLKIKDSLDTDDLEGLELFINEREEIVNKINMTKVHGNELKELYRKYGVFELDQIIVEQIKLEKNQLKNKINEVQKGKKVTQGYNDLNTKSVFLSKTI